MRHAQMPWLYATAHSKDNRQIDIESFMPTAPRKVRRAPTGLELLAKVREMGAATSKPSIR